METLRVNTTIKSDGHLKIDIPTPLLEGDVEVILIIESKKKPDKKYDFSDLAGKLRWNGDALKTQKALRNEWQ
jgi:hypothetical protein